MSSVSISFGRIQPSSIWVVSLSIFELIEPAFRPPCHMSELETPMTRIKNLSPRFAAPPTVPSSKLTMAIRTLTRCEYAYVERTATTGGGGAFILELKRWESRELLLRI